MGGTRGHAVCYRINDNVGIGGKSNASWSSLWQLQIGYNMLDFQFDFFEWKSSGKPTVYKVAPQNMSLRGTQRIYRSCQKSMAQYIMNFVQECTCAHNALFLTVSALKE